MINEIVAACDVDLAHALPDDARRPSPTATASRAPRALARLITGLETGTVPTKLHAELLAAAQKATMPALGITGTGGAGKSSLTDELVRRFRLDQRDALNIAIISIDPSRRKSGGALLGDRIRMNAIEHPQHLHALARHARRRAAKSQALPDVIAACKVAGFDLIIVETSGIGQGDAAIVPLVDVSLYVMTPEFGAASQLEKIDMLDFADFVAINKFDRKGAADALRDVRKQYQRNRERFESAPDEMPVYGTMASRFNDDGVTALYQALAAQLAEHGLKLAPGHAAARWPRTQSTAQQRRSCRRRARAISPRSPKRVRGYHAWARRAGAHRARAAAAARGEADARESATARSPRQPADRAHRPTQARRCDMRRTRSTR